MLAIDPSIFLGMDIFQSGVGEVIHTIKNSMPAEGITEILIPGDGAHLENEQCGYSRVWISTMN